MRTLTIDELSTVSGAGGEPLTKGNNGWGNGAEGTNKGSDEGGTAGSKEDEAIPNGPGPAKFVAR
jgi:hypothetical protein